MILTLDVGNTNMTCGVFDGEEIKATFRITTKIPRTSDEYGMMLCNLLEVNSIKVTDIEDVALGDEVILWDNENITVEQLAEHCDTINYEILCSISDRVPRKFING